MSHKCNGQCLTKRMAFALQHRRAEKSVFAGGFRYNRHNALTGGDDHALTNLNYQQTHFVMSAPDIRHLPSDCGMKWLLLQPFQCRQIQRPEHVDQPKSLARTSKTPGRTQLINLFEVVMANGWSTCRAMATRSPEEMKRKWQRALGAIWRNVKAYRA